MSREWVVAVVAWYVVASVGAFAAFVWDKRAAALGRRRVRERTLHLMEAVGGWPGAVAAMVLLRHKNRKVGYWLVTGGIGVGHLVGWGVGIWER